MVRRRTKARPTVNFYILIAAIAVGVFLIVFFLNYEPTATIESGKISFELEQPSVIARDEEVVFEENYGKITYLAAEGENVAEGAEVAEIYKIGYNDKVLSDLLDVRIKIGQYQENTLLGDIIDQNLVAINTSIEQKAEEIAAVTSGQAEGDLLQLEEDIKRLQQDKLAYLKDTVTPDAQLEEYYQQEDELNERVESWKQVITADREGVVSFYFDGCESVINAGNLENITLEDLSGILNGSTMSLVSRDSQEKPIYRLVNSYKWYLLAVSTTEIPEFEMGRTFTISFDENLDKQYTGKVVGTRDEGLGYVYALEMDDDIGPLISTRRTVAKVATVFEGLQIPSSCIKIVDDTKGIYVKEGDGSTFVPVVVEIEKDGKSIIKPVNEAYTLSVGMEIMT